MKPKIKIYIKLHKPRGYECSHAPTSHESVFALFSPELIGQGLQCAGRLDQDTTGLLLLSNDGDFIHKIEHPKKGYAKTYIATLARSLTEEMKNSLLCGVQLRNEKRPSVALELTLIESKVVKITIKGGVYHQVKRMFAAVGNRVTALHRSRIGEYELGGLKEGEFSIFEP